MSITAETAKHHANDPAVFCCRAEEGITIGPENLEDPAIFDELVDSGLLNLDGCLTIKEVLGAKLIKTCDSLTPITASVIDAPVVAAEEEAVEEAKAEEPAPAVSGSVQGVGAYVSGGIVVLSIKEGKDIYIELPI
jgi:D-proline reductase (dithiol) PrdA